MLEPILLNRIYSKTIFPLSAQFTILKRNLTLMLSYLFSPMKLFTYRPDHFSV